MFPSPFVSPFASPFPQAMPNMPKQKEAPRPPELDLPRALNYYADYSGCGFWRMIWPLGATSKLVGITVTPILLAKDFSESYASIP